MIRYLLLAFVALSSSCFAYKSLLTKGDYLYEVYEPGDRIPIATLCEGLQLYYEAYLSPKLHVGIPLSQLKIDESRFSSYDDFIADMFYNDFLSYQTVQKDRCYYFQARYIPNNQVVSICVMLKQDMPGFFYMDHIGTQKDFRRRGLASTLIDQVKTTLKGCINISLDTRIFNKPAQALYEKSGFIKLATHPNPKKQEIYYHYVSNVGEPSVYSTNSK